MKFGIHNPSWWFGPDPAEAFEAVEAKAQWAENHGFVWFSVMDHLIQIDGVGAPDEPFMEGWTVLSALAAVTSRIRLATLATSLQRDASGAAARFTLERHRADQAGHDRILSQRLMVQTLLSLTEVRDAETGRIGTYETPFVIPNLNKEDKRIPISSVVLSSQRVDMKDALYNTAKDKGVAESVNPLVQEGQKLIPSVTRVFSKTHDMYVYLQAYEQGAETVKPLVAFITFYQGQTKAFETPPT